MAHHQADRFAQAPEEPVVIKPHPGPQTWFLASRAFMVLFGGAAGGGKSWVLIYAAILNGVNTPGWTGLIVRNKQKDLDQPDGLWTIAQELGRLTGGHCRSSSPRDITWPGGGRLVFDYLADGNYRNYKGSALSYLGIDEANECSIEAIIFLMSRLRTTCGAEPVVRMTCNPDPDHELAKWVDPHFLIDGGPDDGCPDRSQSGRIRYFARRAKDDQFCFADTRKEAARLADRKIGLVKSFTFIDALLPDNPSLAGDPAKLEDYLATLALQGAVIEDQLVRGNWRTRAESSGMLALALWGGIDGRLVEPISQIIKWVRAWDLASTKSKPGAKNPDWTVGWTVGWDAFGRWYVADVVLCRLESGGVDDLLSKTASEDGPGVTQVIEQDPASAGKRDVKTTRAVLKSGGNCGPVVSVLANKKKTVKARPMSNELRLGMVGHRPREHAYDKGPRAPRGYFLNASGWMDRVYRDLGVGVTTVGKIVLHQIDRFFDPKIKDDVPDAASIAHNHGTPKKSPVQDVGSRWDRSNS